MGSTSYITDASGEVYQHLEYFAFGETFVEEHSNTDRTPYLYNGKELDEETGLYYYGARYYDAKIGMFYGVDPLAEKFSHLSSYNYASNNPITNIDLWGLQGVKFYDKKDRVVIEQNLVVLTHKPTPVPPGADPKTVREINKTNKKNAASDAAKIAEIKSDIKNYLNHGGDGAKNSKGETVYFKINVIEMEVDDPNVVPEGSNLARRFAIPGCAEDGTQTASLAGIAIDKTSSSLGAFKGGKILRKRWDAPEGTYAHEISHKLGLYDDYPNGDGGVMDSPPGLIRTSEVDEILNKAFEKTME